ncbi:ATP-binding cassette domain-containing protein [Campylobacter sp. 19-13652]|uniref:ATP-binding cassette domain-containing protein n=1 Tax=Campylobacter sp. 19-13652 TaxID=2840180 RepID=UPI001C766ACC|nr:ATP-binding cassette domain-containing protein [Campylobacter sp. 19-13652]BCX78914.1 GTPase [Campylobacter sp. 19-13652]
MINLECEKRLNGGDGSFLLEANMSVNEGEIVALYGRSGSGKTTILRLLAGFETPDSGRISVGGEVFYDSKAGINIPPQRRNIGFLFQNYALFDNMNVEQNLLYAQNDKKLCSYLLEILELKDLARASIESLSGGQKQRVAIARALMRHPRILLLDEPLSALDNAMREKLQDFLLTLYEEFKFTCILISHDIGEIYRLCGRVFSVDCGKISQASVQQKFLGFNEGLNLNLHAKIVDISEIDGAFVVVFSLGQQLSRVLLSKSEVFGLKVGDRIRLSTEAFSLRVNKA